MAWSYFVRSDQIRPLDYVRLIIGDTLRSDQQLQDEEIIAFLGGRANVFGAAADACRSLASKFARSVNFKAGQSSANFSDLSKAYLRMAASFEQQAAKSGAALPYAGGISVADKQNQEQNPDRVPPQFNIGMDDNTIPVGAAGNETQDYAPTTSED